MDAFHLSGDSGEVLGRMSSERKEVRNDDDEIHSLAGQLPGGGDQIRRRAVQEGHIHVLMAAVARQLGGHGAHGIVGRLQAGSVGEHNDAGFHKVGLVYGMPGRGASPQ